MEIGWLSCKSDKFELFKNEGLGDFTVDDKADWFLTHNGFNGYAEWGHNPKAHPCAVPERRHNLDYGYHLYVNDNGKFALACRSFVLDSGKIESQNPCQTRGDGGFFLDAMKFVGTGNHMVSWSITTLARGAEDVTDPRPDIAQALA